MKRRVFNFSTALSLVLCVAALALWARSYFAADMLTLAAGHVWVTAQSGGGQAGIIAQYYPADVERRVTYRSGTVDLPPYTESRLRALVWIHLDSDNRGQTRVLAFPLWFLGAVFALPPGAWWYGRARRRRRAGVCERCGYDLRATPGRCPECGEGR